MPRQSRCNGVLLHILQKMLGHTSVKTTQIYAKTLAEDVAQEFQRLQGLYNTDKE